MNSSVFRRSIPPILLVLCGLALSWPLWRWGLPPQTDDAKCHVAWYIHFAAQFHAGEIYPRWLPNMNAGLGSPAFFYYPPLPSWFAALFNLVFSTSDAWLAVGRSASVALIASGLTMYVWLQTFVTRRWAFVAALGFLFGPYRAATDVYLRGALSEHWAFVWLPLTLWATQNLVAQKHCNWRAWCGLSMTFAFLWLTHPPTAVIFAPVVLAFAALVTSTRSPQKMLMTLSALGFSVLLSSFYLLPALKMEGLVWMEEMRIGVFSYSRAFLTLENARGGLRLQTISLASLMVVATACFVVARAVQNRDDAARLRFRNARFWFAIALFAAFMTMPVSAPLYALLPPLQRIQFPYRWLLVVSFAVAPLSAEMLAVWPQRNELGLKWPLRLFATTCGVMALLWISLQVFYADKAYPRFRHDVLLMKYVDWYVRNGAEMPGHRPRDAHTMKADPPALYRRFGTQSRDYALAEVVRGAGCVRAMERSPRRIELEVVGQDARDLTVRVRQFNFGAWRAMSGTKALRVSSSVPDGLILIDVPANTSRVTLEMPPTPSEIWGRNLSFSALTLWMLLMGSTWIRVRKP